MQSAIQFWQAREPRARIGLACGVVAILAIVASLFVWAYRPDHQVLFADLAPRDAAAMTAELDKLKIEYHLADNGASILVPAALVHKTRLKLMGGEIPLQGAVGFEVFNNADFGMTEFVQRVNYLRAVQGELTRTILSIDGIAAARVHLAVPEQGLFKKSASKPTASVTLKLKQGHTLAPAQINGIARLVAASVPEVAMQDVTILDQNGLALTRPSAEQGSALTGGAQLDDKRSAEDYLQEKITEVLDQTFGPGEAIARVDLLLGSEHAKVTTEEVLSGQAEQGTAGVLVRKRESGQEGGTLAPGATDKQAGATNFNTETDYQVGRRVEQRTMPSGAVKRMTIAVVVRKRLDEGQVERLREVVGLAAGLDARRGDAIVVDSIDRLADPEAVEAPFAPAALAAAQARASSAPALAGERVLLALAAALAVALLLLLLLPLAALWRRRQRRQQPPIARLDDAQRAKMLSDVRRWIAMPSAPPNAMGAGPMAGAPQRAPTPAPLTHPGMPAPAGHPGAAAPPAMPAAPPARPAPPPAPPGSVP